MRKSFVLGCIAVLGWTGFAEAQGMGRWGRQAMGERALAPGRGMGTMRCGGCGRWAMAGKATRFDARGQRQRWSQGQCFRGGRRAGPGFGPRGGQGCRLIPTLAAPATDFDEASVSKALRSALLQEYANGAYYKAVLTKFGPSRRFENLRAAEGRHAEAVLALFNRYGLEPPTASEAEVPEVPVTLSETIQVAIRLEEKDVATFDDLLESDLPDDVKAVFRQLRTVSAENHLEALKRGAGGGGRQSGRGFRGGRAS